MIMNSYEGLVDFTFPASEGGEGWSLLVDTNIPDSTADTVFKFGSVYQVTGRSLLLFAVKSA
jgi:isoamylase